MMYSILDSVVDVEVSKIDTSFLATYQNVCWYSELFCGNYHIPLAKILLNPLIIIDIGYIDPCYQRIILLALITISAETRFFVV